MIVGMSSGNVSNQYHEKLSNMKTQMRLNNIELRREISFDDLLDTYARAKVFLHALKNEHFGIAVVGALAAGLIPVVHRSGEPWEDILQGKQEIHGYSYLTADEASRIILRLQEGDISEETRRRNVKYASSFSSVAFEEKLLGIVYRYAKDIYRSSSIDS